MLLGADAVDHPSDIVDGHVVEDLNGPHERVDLDFGRMRGECGALPATVIAVDAAANDRGTAAIDDTRDGHLEGRVSGALDELAVNRQVIGVHARIRLIRLFGIR